MVHLVVYLVDLLGGIQPMVKSRSVRQQMDGSPTNGGLLGGLLGDLLGVSLGGLLGGLLGDPLGGLYWITC